MDKVQEEIQWFPERGEILLRGGRFFLQRVDFIRALKMEMIRTMGERGARAVLHLVAKRGGMMVGEAVKKTYGIPPSFDKALGMVDIMSRVFPVLGWGLTEARSEPQSGEIIIRISNSYETSPEMGELVCRPACYILEGYLEGVMQAMFGEEISLREVKCVALGDENCEFIATKGGGQA